MVDVVSRDEFLELVKKVEELENRVEQLENTVANKTTEQCLLRPSLANTNKKYTTAQIRVRGCRIHVQVHCTKCATNRVYGLAFDIDPHSVFDHNEGITIDSSEFVEWLNGQKHTLPSLAGTEEMYVPAQVRLIDGERLHFQINGTKFNRDYGAAFDVNINDVKGATVEEIREFFSCVGSSSEPSYPVL